VTRQQQWDFFLSETQGSSGLLPHLGWQMAQLTFRGEFEGNGGSLVFCGEASSALETAPNSWLEPAIGLPLLSRVVQRLQKNCPID